MKLAKFETEESLSLKALRPYMQQRGSVSQCRPRCLSMRLIGLFLSQERDGAVSRVGLL